MHSFKQTSTHASASGVTCSARHSDRGAYGDISTGGFRQRYPRLEKTRNEPEGSSQTREERERDMTRRCLPQTVIHGSK